MARHSRREENQKLFRRGNEALHNRVAAAVPEDATVPFLCECAAEDCNGRVEVTLQQWELVAAQANRYLMIPEHLLSEGEEVVGYVREYEVVEKPA